MSWNRIAGSFKRLKDEIVFQWCRLTDDKSRSFDLIAAECRATVKAVMCERRSFAPTTAESRASFRCTLAAN